MTADPRKEQSAETRAQALTWIALGLFYKLALATLLGQFVDSVWSDPTEINPAAAWIGVYAYAFQLYCDFCGYSYLAMAVALLLGLHIPPNFDRPYLARSIQEFWRRWHISLSTWLRDYVYIGWLGGNANGRYRQVRNVVVTFLLCGAWHGLATHYLVWGAWHALGVAWSAVIRLFGTSEKIAPNMLRDTRNWVVSFHFVALGWVLFRAESLDQASAYLSRLWAPGAHWEPEFLGVLLALAVAALLHLGEHRVSRGLVTLQRLARSELLVTVIAAALVVTVLAVSPAGLPPFIYFKY